MRKKIITVLGVLLSLAVVFGSVAAFRGLHRASPPDPVMAVEALTEAERVRNSRSETTTLLTEPSQPEQNRTMEPQTTKLSADSEKSASSVPTSGKPSYSFVESANGLTESGIFVRPGSGQAITPKKPVAESTTAVTEANTQKVNVTSVSAQPTKPQSPEVEETLPTIQTNLSNKILKKSELTDGKYLFYAYLTGDVQDCILKVQLYTNSNLSGIVLTPSGTSYQAPLELGKNTVSLFLKKGSETLSQNTFTLTLETDKATSEKTEVGQNPPQIQTNLDSWTEEIRNNRFNFFVTATAGNGNTLSADYISVTLDGKTIRNPTGSGTFAYELSFPQPNVGETETHLVSVTAWDGQGNSVYKEFVVTYHHVSEGDKTGEVTIILDATTVGLGVLDTATYTIHQGENAANLLEKFLTDFGYDFEHGGSMSEGYYLRRVTRGDLAYDAKIPDKLAEYIRRDGFTISPITDRDSLGEHDFTKASGWMYSVGSTLYPGKGMDKTYLSPGDVLRVSFTLAYGKDIGGSDSSTGNGALHGYCGIWQDDVFIEKPHHFENGVCSECGEVQKKGEAA